MLLLVKKSPLARTLLILVRLAASNDLHTEETEMLEEDRTVGVSDAGLNTSEIVTRDHGHSTGGDDIQ